MLLRISPEKSGANQAISLGAFVVIFPPVSIVFFGSRWLSQIPVGPVFLYDLLLGIVGTVATLTLIVGRRRIPQSRLVLSTILLVLPLAALIQLIFSGISFASLREFAPYLYLVYGWFVFLLLPLLSPMLVKRGLFVVFVGLGVHWAWVVLNRLGFGNFLQVEAFGTTFFSVRADIDTTLIGVFGAAILGCAIFHAGSPTLRATMLVSALIVLSEVFFAGTRAGHLAAVASTIVFLILAFLIRRESKKTTSGQSLLGISFIWVLVLVVPVLFSPLTGKYLGVVEALNPVGLSQQEIVNPSSTVEDPLGSEGIVEVPQTLVADSGTTNARLNSWGILIEWITSDPQRILVGVGFGSGYMYESGALEALIGPEAGSRADEGIGPHNVFLFVFATMGVFGLLYFVGLIIFVSALGLRILTQGNSILYPFALSVLAGIGTASLFGVVFEAPHGAIPMAWAIGILMTGLNEPGKKKERSGAEG
jgi:hypothetical protein